MCRVRQQVKGLVSSRTDLREERRFFRLNENDAKWKHRWKGGMKSMGDCKHKTKYRRAVAI